jgi:hypothetical protein
MSSPQAGGGFESFVLVFTFLVFFSVLLHQKLEKIHAILATKFQTHDLAEDSVKLRQLTTTLAIEIVKNCI